MNYNNNTGRRSQQRNYEASLLHEKLCAKRCLSVENMIQCKVVGKTSAQTLNSLYHPMSGCFPHQLGVRCDKISAKDFSFNFIKISKVFPEIFLHFEANFYIVIRIVRVVSHRFRFVPRLNFSISENQIKEASTDKDSENHPKHQSGNK